MATSDDAQVRDFLEELEMGDWDGEPLDCETEKAWDAMHRCLSDGAAEVVQVASALETVDETWMRQRYDRIDPTNYQGFLDDEDFEYTWYWFTQVREFYRQAAEAHRPDIFTVDQ